MKLDLCSFLNQHHWVPLAFINGGIDIRLTLADPASVTVLNTAGGEPTNSQDYQLENIAFSASLKTIDSALQEMYYKQLAEGGSLLIHCKQYSHNTTYLTPAGTGDFAVSINKPVSRLSTFIATMCNDLQPEQIAAGTQYCNTFLAYPGNSENFEAQLQLGSMRYPDAPIQGYAQAFLAHTPGTWHCEFGITRYRNRYAVLQ